MAQRSEVVLCARGLRKEFGKITAVRNLDLELRRGEILGFLGPNGSGKSTTIGMLLGLIAPTSGAVELFGKPLQQCGPAQFRRVGTVLENPPLYPFLSGRDNLEVLARLTETDSNRIDQVLDLVRLTERADSKVNTYSQGMKQRLSLAAALLTEPEVLILDEPTNGMDPSGMLEVRQLIGEMGRRGVAVFLSSHLLHEVQQVGTRVIIIKEGNVLAQGQVEELLRRREVLQIRVSQPSEALALLRGLEWVRDVGLEGEMLLVETPRERVAEITAFLAGKGVFPSELRFREDTLEGFFQEVTQQGTNEVPG